MKLVLKVEQLKNLQEAESFTDYPQSATNNAKKALRWKKEHGKEVKGGTAVGWARARQLANRRPLSKSTIKRMAQFARHLKNNEVDSKYKSEPWKDRGRIANLIWGGAAGINWARRKSKSFQKEHQEIAKKSFLEGYNSIVNPSILKESVNVFNKETFLLEEIMFLQGYLKALKEQQRATDNNSQKSSTVNMSDNMYTFVKRIQNKIADKVNFLSRSSENIEEFRDSVVDIIDDVLYSFFDQGEIKIDKDEKEIVVFGYYDDFEVSVVVNLNEEIIDNSDVLVDITPYV